MILTKTTVVPVILMLAMARVPAQTQSPRRVPQMHAPAVPP